MVSENKTLSRRQFIKTTGMAGVGTLLAARASARPAPSAVIAQKTASARVPTRPFGNSGRRVSILSMGGMYDIAANQLMLRQAVRWGVTYWDTADCYQSGSERGIGKYFAKYPQDREKIFLVTKSDARNPQGAERLLEQSLARMNTGYIDLYFIHGIRSINEMTTALRQWAEKAKAAEKIRLFGFSTHSNMAECLQGASRLGWVDGIMMSYNFRNMNTPEMQAAVAACHQAGIGLTAMKTQGARSYFSGWNESDDTRQALLEKLMQNGWTMEQARLKAVWQDSRIASICSQMDSMRLLKANVDAALDPRPLSSEQIDLFRRYALATADQYCAGCSRLCESVFANRLPISDVMRSHMYCRSYGRADWSRARFSDIPQPLLREMAATDFQRAEAVCPQKLPIGNLIRRGLEDFV